MGPFASFVGGVEVEAYGSISIAFDNLLFDSLRERLFSFRRRRLVAFGEFVITFADEADGGEIVTGGAKKLVIVWGGVGSDGSIPYVWLIPVGARGVLRSFCTPRFPFLNYILFDHIDAKSFKTFIVLIFIEGVW